MNNHRRSLIAQYEPNSVVVEQYRTIRTNIEYAGLNEQMQTIMVTSAAPEEGKSTTIANIAVVFAQQGKKVLLIDADLRKPTTHYTLSLSNAYGLTTVLTKQKTLRDSITSTNIPNLDVLTSGPIPPNPAELLGAQAFNEMLDELKGMYDTVLIDTPPILAVTDAQILANKCDGSILVLSSGKTEIEGAKKAKDILSKGSGKLLGAVLNQKVSKKDDHYYYYGTK